MPKNNEELNSFEKLQRESEERFNEERKDNIKSGIWSVLGTFRFVGQIVDVYIPKFVKFLIAISGGEEDNDVGTKRSGEGYFVLGSGLDSGVPPSDEEDDDEVSDEKK